ncbi:pyridoxamine 5'-phosphate oxidase family protein [Streptomyces formicae]|uniref:Pyridoxamine 5'-phosphate oxidase family protein n=1 Tax=Streptomyces formicae TaxID=1616117 RepID=A0ABY3WER2_9ACTN|nr:pyridoxamine 5'-phosphate oxidase family protein [Streptomyces formicae]UNM10185.1 pyridoxamine 5'-phosphate oxidase family protein [Streptomyces formicae]
MPPQDRPRAPAELSAEPSAELRDIELLSRVPYGRLATSLHAMPFVAPARHVVSGDGNVLLRVHAGLECARSCVGSVVAYGADNLNSGATALWSVQCTGTAEIVEPTAAEVASFGPGPDQVDGEPFEPVYMRLRPRFVTVHTSGSTPHTSACTEERFTERSPIGGSVERSLRHAG